MYTEWGQKHLIDKFKELNLTEEETAMILGIARRFGKDRDGDTLTFYVQVDPHLGKLVWSPDLFGPMNLRTVLEVPKHKKRKSFLSWLKHFIFK